MRILYITTIGSTMGFFSQFIKELLDNGHRVDIATNENERKVQTCYRDWGCKVYQISFIRSPFSKKNLKAISEIRNIVANNSYDIVHCHTPIAAACTRLACLGQRRAGLKVIYTAHGFHFYKGAPLKNWLLYYPIEKILSYWTDVLITINREDYQRAKKSFYAKKIEYVQGVGIDLDRFSATKEIKARVRKRVREKLGLQESDIVVLSAGELNRNKNHAIIIKAIASLSNKKVHYIIAGRGPLEYELRNLAESLGISNQVHLLGFRDDIPNLCFASDIFCFPSFREGLGLAAIEAMAAGLPLLTSNVHGINDYSEDGVTGYKFLPNDVYGFKKGIAQLVEDKMIYTNFATNNINRAQRYDWKLINEKMRSIYIDDLSD